MAEKVTWENFVELAGKIRENPNQLTKDKIAEHGRKLDDYICAYSKKQTHEENAEWLSIKRDKTEYEMNVTFYQRVTVLAKDYNPKNAMRSKSLTILCYRISEIEKCSAEEVCETLITLGLFSKGTRVRQDLLDEIKGDSEIKDNLSSDNITEDISIEQESHNIPEKSMDGSGLAENSTEGASLQNNGGNAAELYMGYDKCQKDSIEDNMNGVQSNISHADADNAPEIAEEDLKTYVIGFIEAMSYKIEAFHPIEHSNCSELFSIFLDESCVDELSIFHQDIKPWEIVWVSCFVSGTADEEIQREIERIHKLEKRPKAFVIIACATDEIFKYVKENLVCDRQKSIMILCREHPDEAHIHLRGNKKSDEKRFEFLKPDSKKYIYI